jgi:hypothetical protein
LLRHDAAQAPWRRDQFAILDHGRPQQLNNRTRSASAGIFAYGPMIIETFLRGQQPNASRSPQHRPTPVPPKISIDTS